MPTHGYQALDAWTSRMPASNALLEPVFQHESNALQGRLVRYGPAQNAPSSASADSSSPDSFEQRPERSR